MWSYIFLVRDIINNKIIFHTLASYQEDKKALPQIVNELKESDNHSEVRCCVLKICSLLSRLKVVNE